MNKIKLKILGYSVLLTTSTASLFGLAGQSIIGTFWSWFWVSLLAMFILFAIVNSYFIQKDDNILRQTELQTLEAISKFSITLNCAYCNQQNTLPIQLNKRNTFKCGSCNQANGVSMQFMATTITTPIESVKIPVTGDSTATFSVL